MKIINESFGPRHMPVIKSDNQLEAGQLRHAWRLLIGSVVAGALIWPLVFWATKQP